MVNFCDYEENLQPFYIFTSPICFTFLYDIQITIRQKHCQSDRGKANEFELTHRFYLIGDAGNAEEPEAQETLKLFEERLKESDENATLVFG